LKSADMDGLKALLAAGVLFKQVPIRIGTTLMV
jgi:hypothetical protein